MTRRAILRAARRAEPCTYCGARAGHSCPCGGAHLCRIALAAHDGHITMRDFASIIPDGDAFTGASLVLDEVSA